MTIDQEKIQADLNSKLKDIETRLEEIKKRTEVFVKENPLLSISLALGLGYIIGKMINGRKQ